MGELLAYIVNGGILLLFLTGTIRPAWVKMAQAEVQPDPEWRACYEKAMNELTEIEQRQGLS